MKGWDGEEIHVAIQRQTIRRRIAKKLRYSKVPGGHRWAEVWGASDWQHAVMALTGSNWGGNYDPPFAPTLRYPWQGGERVVTNNNDGMELWFGYPNKWGWSMGNREVKLLTLWLIWDWWIKARWLGLRRPIYYFALHSVVAKYKTAGPR